MLYGNPRVYAFSPTTIRFFGARSLCRVVR